MFHEELYPLHERLDRALAHCDRQFCCRRFIWSFTWDVRVWIVH